MRPFSYHNHTIFDDGKSTVDEMVQAAIAHGCDAIGFSGHSFVPPDPDYCMPIGNIQPYRAEVLAAKEKYKDKIKIFLGIEQDVDSDVRLYEDAYDYKIGAVHGVIKNGKYYSVDGSAEELSLAIQEGYGGDVYALCEDYFESLSHICEITRCDVAGHVDIVAKFNEGGRFFDENNERYVAAAERAIKKLARDGMIFEINTGAMSRGYRTAPYPARRLLEIIRREGAGVTYSSDCHAAEKILFGYDDTVNLARECGFEGFMKLTEDGFRLVQFDEI